MRKETQGKQNLSRGEVNKNAIVPIATTTTRIETQQGNDSHRREEQLPRHGEGNKQNTKGIKTMGNRFPMTEYLRKQRILGRKAKASKELINTRRLGTKHAERNQT